MPEEAPQPEKKAKMPMIITILLVLFMLYMIINAVYIIKNDDEDFTLKNLVMPGYIDSFDTGPSWTPPYVPPVTEDVTEEITEQPPYEPPPVVQQTVEPKDEHTTATTETETDQQVVLPEEEQPILPEQSRDETVKTGDVVEDQTKGWISSAYESVSKPVRKNPWKSGGIAVALIALVGVAKKRKTIIPKAKSLLAKPKTFLALKHHHRQLESAKKQFEKVRAKNKELFDIEAHVFHLRNLIAFNASHVRRLEMRDPNIESHSNESKEIVQEYRTLLGILMDRFDSHTNILEILIKKFKEMDESQITNYLNTWKPKIPEFFIAKLTELNDFCKAPNITSELEIFNAFQEMESRKDNKIVVQHLIKCCDSIHNECSDIDQKLTQLVKRGDGRQKWLDELKKESGHSEIIEAIVEDKILLTDRENEGQVIRKIGDALDHCLAKLEDSEKQLEATTSQKQHAVNHFISIILFVKRTLYKINLAAKNERTDLVILEINLDGKHNIFQAQSPDTVGKSPLQKVVESAREKEISIYEMMPTEKGGLTITEMVKGHWGTVKLRDVLDAIIKHEQEEIKIEQKEEQTGKETVELIEKEKTEIQLEEPIPIPVITEKKVETKKPKEDDKVHPVRIRYKLPNIGCLVIITPLNKEGSDDQPYEIETKHPENKQKVIETDFVIHILKKHTLDDDTARFKIRAETENPFFSASEEIIHTMYLSEEVVDLRDKNFLIPSNKKLDISVNCDSNENGFLVLNDKNNLRIGMNNMWKDVHQYFFEWHIMLNRKDRKYYSIADVGERNKLEITYSGNPHQDLNTIENSYYFLRIFDKDTNIECHMQKDWIEIKEKRKIKIEKPDTTPGLNNIGNLEIPLTAEVTPEYMIDKRYEMQWSILDKQGFDQVFHGVEPTGDYLHKKAYESITRIELSRIDLDKMQGKHLYIVVRLYDDKKEEFVKDVDGKVLMGYKDLPLEEVPHYKVHFVLKQIMNIPADIVVTPLNKEEIAVNAYTSVLKTGNRQIISYEFDVNFSDTDVLNGMIPVRIEANTKNAFFESVNLKYEIPTEQRTVEIEQNLLQKKKDCALSLYAENELTITPKEKNNIHLQLAAAEMTTFEKIGATSKKDIDLAEYVVEMSIEAATDKGKQILLSERKQGLTEISYNKAPKFNISSCVARAKVFDKTTNTLCAETQQDIKVKPLAEKRQIKIEKPDMLIIFDRGFQKLKLKANVKPFSFAWQIGKRYDIVWTIPGYDKIRGKSKTIKVHQNQIQTEQVDVQEYKKYILKITAEVCYKDTEENIGEAVGQKVITEIEIEIIPSNVITDDIVTIKRDVRTLNDAKITLSRWNKNMGRGDFIKLLGLGVGAVAVGSWLMNSTGKGHKTQAEMQRDTIPNARAMEVTVPLTLAGKIIALDAGHHNHDYKDPGHINSDWHGTCSGFRNNNGKEDYIRFHGHELAIRETTPDGKEHPLAGVIPESHLVEDIVKRIEKKLKAKGARVILTRPDWYNHPRLRNMKKTLEKASESLKIRANTASAANAQFFITVHANGITNPHERGYFSHMYVKGFLKDNYPTEESRIAHFIEALFIEKINDAVGSLGITPYNGMHVPRNDLGIVNNSRVPILLLETGHLTNEADVNIMVTTQFREKMAQGIVNALEELFRTRYFIDTNARPNITHNRNRSSSTKRKTTEDVQTDSSNATSPENILNMDIKHMEIEPMNIRMRQYKPDSLIALPKK